MSEMKIVIDHGVLGYFATVAIKVENTTIVLNEGQSMRASEMDKLAGDLERMAQDARSEAAYLQAGAFDRETRRSYARATVAPEGDKGGE